MTISFVDFVYGSSGSPPTDPTATTQACTAGGTAGALNVLAGDLLVGFIKYETSAGGTVGISAVTGGTNAFTMGTLLANAATGDMWTMSGWNLAATADPAAVFQFTTSLGVNYRRIAVAQFRGEPGKTFSMVTSAQGQGGTSTTLVTSSFSAASTDQLLIMGTGLYGSTTYSTTTFGGVAATQPAGSPIDNTLLSYLMSGPVSGIVAQCTTAAGFEWNIQADVFSLDTAPTPPETTTYSFPNSFFFGANQ